MNAQSSTVLTTSDDFTAAVTRVVEFEVSAREPCFYWYTQQIIVQVMSIFDSFIVRQADIYSYSVIVTVTAEGFILAFKVDDDDNNDDDNAFKYRDYEQL